MRLDEKWREVVTLALPVVITKLSFTAMGLVNTAMVGRLGPSEQAAVGIATTFMFTLYVFGLGLVGVVNTFVSQNHGAGRPEMCGVVLGHGLRLATVVVFIVAGASLLRREGNPFAAASAARRWGALATAAALLLIILYRFGDALSPDWG